MAPEAVHRKALELARYVVRMTSAAGSGHASSALSLAHLVTHLMYNQMRHDPQNPWNRSADRLVLSEGHAVPIVYAAWADLGGVVGKTRPDATRHPGSVIRPGWSDRSGQTPLQGLGLPETPADTAGARRLTPRDLAELRTRDSVLDGHPNPAEGFPFFDAATGSLGQGLSVAAGVALASRLMGTSRRVYVVIGDGESREGQIWEALDFIIDHGLTDVVAVFNCNGQGQAGHVSPQQSPERLAAKLEAFGWKVRVIDGHDPAQIAEALAGVEGNSRPLAVVARTVKGWGVPQLQDGNWHGRPLPAPEIERAEQVLARELERYASAPSLKAPPAPPADRAPVFPSPAEVSWPGFAECMEQAGFGAALKKGLLATRKAYGAALAAAGHLLPQLVVLDADVSNSTFTELFAAAHPQRFIECRIAEQNMASVAVGLSAGGLLPFVNTFAKFVARACDQVELASISRANIKIVGSHAGVSPAADGPSQMGLLDVAYFHAFTTVRGDDRVRPLCWFFQPADAVAAFHCTRLMTMLEGMCYMRTHRPDVPLLYAPETTFTPGGFQVLAQGEDLALVTAGYMVHECRRAVDLLGRQRIRAALIDAYCLPVDRERLADALRRAGGRVLVVEDNYGGGLGAAVALLAGERPDIQVRSLHVQRIPKSTLTPDEELEYCGVGAAQIADHALALLKRPR